MTNRHVLMPGSSFGAGAERHIVILGATARSLKCVLSQQLRRAPEGPPNDLLSGFLRSYGAKGFGRRRRRGGVAQARLAFAQRRESYAGGARNSAGNCRASGRGQDQRRGARVRSERS